MNNEEEKDFFNTCKDNSIDWYTGKKTITVTFSQRKFINKIEKFASDRPTEVHIVARNKDGSIVAHIPLSYVKLSQPRDISEEQRDRMRRVAKANIKAGKFGKVKKN